MHVLTPLMIWASVASDEAPAAASDLPAWATLGLAAIGLISTLGLAWIGYLTNKNSKHVQANSEAIAEVQNTANATERKVTSNHGHDNIGDKVDQLVSRVGDMTLLMDRVVEITVHQDERIARMESVTATAAGQSADNAVIAATSFEELNAKLDGLTVIRPPARILPLVEPTPGHPRRADQHCHRPNCDRTCGRRHD